MDEIAASTLAIGKALSGKRNFALIAGAGSGKTGALVRALLDIRELYGKQFRQSGQKVACITYTNVAVEVIMRRTDADDLFLVSTIHGFLWSLIGQFDDDLRHMLKTELIPARIEKKKKDDKGESKKAQTARAQIARLQDGLEKIDAVATVNYDISGRRNYAKGRIDHDDVIDLAALLLARSTALQRIISQRFPIILVDEAQDTFPSVMEALNSIVSIDGFPIMGYFGDPMQQIYENRTGQFGGPPGTETIKIEENYRCSIEVIKLLNKVRTDIVQVPGKKNVQGSVGIMLVQTEEGKGNRKSYDEAQLLEVRGKFEAAMKALGWSDDPEVKKLFLTRQMIAHRLGFADLNRLFTGDFSSKAAEDDFKEGTHFLLEPFVQTLIPVVQANRESNGDAVMQILMKTSPFLNPRGQNRRTAFGDVVASVHAALNRLNSVWDTATTGELVKLAGELELIEISDRLAEHVNRAPRPEQYDEITFGAEREDWLADKFFTFPVKEIASYRDFVLKSTPYSTQHGVKGDQFEKVLVVFDDTEANWQHYSFSKFFTPKTAGSDPTEGQAEKSANLAYVCFSRAQRDLRILLFTKDVANARQELMDIGLFLKDQIMVQQ